MSSIAALLQAAEYIDWYERGMSKEWQDLPDELILKILSYSEVEDLISCGQVSKRTRNISRDTSLWVIANLEEKIVKTELLELILTKGCKILNISDSTIVGSLSSNIKSQLRVLNLSQYAWGFPVRHEQGQMYYEENINVLEELLSSCCSLQHLEMVGLRITPNMAISICKNGKTLQGLNLKSSFVDDGSLDDGSSYLHNAQHGLYFTLPKTPNGNFNAIIQCCQELKEVNLHCTSGEQGLADYDLKFLVSNITPNLEEINFWNHEVVDDHVKILLSRCKKIKALSLDTYFITANSFALIKQYRGPQVRVISSNRITDLARFEIPAN